MMERVGRSKTIYRNNFGRSNGYLLWKNYWYGWSTLLYYRSTLFIMLCFRCSMYLFCYYWLWRVNSPSRFVKINSQRQSKWNDPQQPILCK